MPRSEPLVEPPRCSVEPLRGEVGKWGNGRRGKGGEHLTFAISINAKVRSRKKLKKRTIQIGTARTKDLRYIA